MKAYLEEVSQRIHSGGSTIPALRKMFRKKYSFSGLPFAEQLIIWEYVWKYAPSWQVKTQAFFIAKPTR